MGNQATGGNIFGGSRLRGRSLPLPETPPMSPPLTTMPTDTAGNIPTPGLISDIVRGPLGGDVGLEKGYPGGNMPDTRDQLPELPSRARGFPPPTPRFDGGELRRIEKQPQPIQGGGFIGDMINRPAPTFRTGDTLEAGNAPREIAGGGRTPRKPKAKGPGDYITNRVDQGRLRMF